MYKWILLCFVLAAAGCAPSNVVSKDFVTQRAASDLECPNEQVSVEQQDDTNWKAQGCEQQANYVCWTSVGMGEGTCQKQ
ncbi:MAG: hypothetical protein ACOC9W_03725 [Persicimonas sp.]